MESKKSQIGIILLIVFLMAALLLGVILAVGSVVLDWTADTAIPELTSLGMVGSTNMTEIAGYTITPVNTMVQSLSWMAGLVYVLGLVSCFVLAFAFRYNKSKILIGLFVGLMVLLLIMSILISNIYQDLYEGVDEVGTRLKEHFLLSWGLLYSPVIMCFIGFICGIIMFTGEDGGGI